MKLTTKIRLLAAIGVAAVCAFTLYSLRMPQLHLDYFTSPSYKQGNRFRMADKVSEYFNLSGAIMDEDGVHKEFAVELTVSLAHSYSPYTEEHFREMMVDPNKHEHRIYANSPAILMSKPGEITTVMRIWLEKEIWELNKMSPTNTFSDNYFYIQRFDDQMQPISQGRILGIVTPIQWSIGDGPIEPRIFEVNNTIYLTFNTGVYQAAKKPIDSTFFWDLTRSKALLPEISGGNPMLNHYDRVSMPRDKHWSALVNGTKLYFTYNLDPLRVIDCHLEEKASCHFVHKEGPEDWKFNDYRDSVRGGTPFVLYSYPYYVSVAHGTLFRDCNQPGTNCNYKRFYTTHLIVMTIEPTFKIVYISNNIPYPESSLKVPIVRYRYIQNSFFFPVGLVLENEDSLIMGGHINDHSSVLYRISGISAIMNSIKNFTAMFPKKQGPKPEALQNFIRSRTSLETGFKFYAG